MFIPATAARAARTGSTSGKTTIGFLPPSSRLTCLISSAAPRSTARPGGHRAGEGDPRDVGVRDERRPGGGAAPVTTLSTPGGSRSAAIRASSRRGQRGLLAGLDDDRVAGGERGGGLAGGELERVVERHDPADHAVGLALGPRQRVGQRRAADAAGLRGDPGEEPDLVRRLRDVPAHAGQRVAAVRGRRGGPGSRPRRRSGRRARAAGRAPALPAERRPARAASRAAATAAVDVLGGPASGTVPSTSSVVGSTDSSTAPEAAGTHAPPTCMQRRGRRSGRSPGSAHRGAVRTWTTATAPARARGDGLGQRRPSVAGSVTVSAAQHP